MRNILFVLLLFALNGKYSKAQVPQSLNYQAGIYDLTGMPIFNKNANLRMSILDSSSTGPVVYDETFATTTDVNGLFNVNLGTGNATIGRFDSIDWSNGNKWLKTEIDTGNGFMLMGTTKFLSVPYALYAEKTNGGFGNRTYHMKNTAYKATTDGFVTVYLACNTSTTVGCSPAYIYSDSSPSPTTLVGKGIDWPSTFISPIIKNDYWKVVPGAGCSCVISSITWLPLK